MSALATWCHALAFGLAVGGLAGAVAEWWTGRRLAFRPPYVDPGRIGAALALSAVLGPYMLFNEALAAHRAARIAPSVLIAAAGAALAWALAAGIVLVFLVGGAARMVAA